MIKYAAKLQDHLSLKSKHPQTESEKENMSGCSHIETAKKSYLELSRFPFAYLLLLATLLFLFKAVCCYCFAVAKITGCDVQTKAVEKLVVFYTTTAINIIPG